MGQIAMPTISIKTVQGNTTPVHTDLTNTVGEFKALVEEATTVPVASQRLIYRGAVLKDDRTLESYSIEDGHQVHMVRSVSSNSSDASPAQGGAAAGPAMGNAGTSGSSPFGLFGGNLGGGGGMPSMAQMQQQMMANPQMMQDMMQNPMMQSLMNNPQMQQILEAHPELNHVLNDPEMLRQHMQAMSNPNLQQELMRSQDRALSNIESHPEGFNALRRMYSSVQEPLMDGLSDLTRGSTTNTPSQPSAPVAPGTPMPNPWGGDNSSPGASNVASSGTPNAAMPPAFSNGLFGAPAQPLSQQPQQQQQQQQQGASSPF